MTKRQFAFNFVSAVCALFSLTTLHAQNHSHEVNGAHVYVAVAEDASLNINNDCTPTSSSSIITACDDYVWNGMLLIESGVYEYITTNSNGCDSTATLNQQLLITHQVNQLLSVVNTSGMILYIMLVGFTLKCLKTLVDVTVQHI